MTEEDKKNQSVRKLLVETGAESNVHGISRIVSDRPLFLRFLWLVAFLGAGSFGIFQVSTIIRLFQGYPVKTNVKIAFSPLEFPAITLCNMNIIKKSQSGNLKSKDLKDILNGTYDVDAGYYSSSSSAAPTTLAQPSTTTATGSGTGSPTPTGTPSSTAGSPSYTTGNPYNGYTTSNPDWYAQWSSWYYNDGTSDYYGTADRMEEQMPIVVDKSYAIFETFIEEYQKLDRTHRTDIGHQFGDMLVDCQFAGMSCDSPTKKIVTSDYGNCYTLQSPRYITGSSGPKGGMTITINLENHESFPQMSEGYGLRVVIHEIGSFPLPAQEGMTVSGGYETSLGIKLTKINRKGPPYTICQDPRAYFKQNFVRYSTQGCIQTCWETVVFDHCGCIDGYMITEMDYFHDGREAIPNNTDSGSLNISEPSCFASAVKDCYTNLRRTFLMNVAKYCECPPPCTQNVYTTTFSGRLWPHETKLSDVSIQRWIKLVSWQQSDDRGINKLEGYGAELTNKSCDGYNTEKCGLKSLNGTALHSNFLKIHIYFEDLNYEEITEEPLYDINQVIADIGGSLGLCIGASLLCVCEGIEAIIQIILVVKRKLTGMPRVMSKGTT